MSVPDPEKMKAFLEFVKNEAANPPTAASLMRIPSNLTPEWSQFFSKILRFCEKSIGTKEKQDRMEIMAWEKRLWNMEDNDWDEFDMLRKATMMKEDANKMFKAGDIAGALIRYIMTMFVFPMPDVSNNVAACALKENQFKLAEEYASKALSMEMFTNPFTETKAFYRRAQARQRLGNFQGSLEDFDKAIALQPSNTDIQTARSTLLDLKARTQTAEALRAYVASQPSAHAPVDREQAIRAIGRDDSQAIGHPHEVDMTMVQPPVF